MKKLTAAEIEEAVSRYQSGLSLMDVARMFGVSAPAIGGLLARRGIARRTLSESKRTLACNHAYFSEPLDEERAYWIGFILADGAIIEKSYGVTASVAVALKAEDKGHLQKLKSALQSEHKIVNTKGTKGHLGVRLAISSTELSESLKKFNVLPRKSNQQIMTDLIPPPLLSHYFRGYFDGNGCIARHSRSRWIVSTVSSELFLSCFLDWIAGKLGGNRPKITFSDGIHRIAWAGTHRCKEILDLLYKDATMFLDRKKKLYDEVCMDSYSSHRGPYNRK